MGSSTSSCRQRSKPLRQSIRQEVDRGFTLKMGEGVAGKIAAEAQELVLRHAATDPLVKSQALRERGVRALYGVPLSHGGSVVGVAYMASRTAFQFSEEDKLLFRTMASRATFVIVQAQLVTNLETAVADRDRLVTQVAGERARLEQILNQIPIGVLIADAPTADISFLNKRTRELLGEPPRMPLPAAEYRGWRPFHLDGRPYAPDETPRQRALLGEQVVDEFKVQRSDGSWMMLRATAAPVRRNDGQIQTAVVAFDDVSAQKRYEETLRFLSDASRQLAESIDYEATLAQVARLAVPGIADWVSVDLLRDGEICPLVVSHANPAKVELAREFRRRFPPDPAAPSGAARVLREGQPELYEDIKVAQGFADRAAMAIENARLFGEAERASRLREQVLAVVSHDLRNPLSTINMSAAITLEEGRGRPRRAQAGRSRRACGPSHGAPHR